MTGPVVYIGKITVAEQFLPDRKRKWRKEGK